MHLSINCLTALIAAAPLLAQAPIPATPAGPAATQTLSRETQTQIVNEISKALIDEYIFLDVAQKCSKHIQAKLKDGCFDGMTDVAFAKAMTRELQTISRDKHMQIRPNRYASPLLDPSAQISAPSMNPQMLLFQQKQVLAPSNNGFPKVEILEGNVGYVETTNWFPSALSRETISATMKFLANVDAIIVDERSNRGGDPSGVRYFSSYFFDKPTHLNSLYWRKRNQTVEFWTFEQVDGKKLVDVPLFVLTSNQTFSAAEEFANNLQARKRALIVGEVTGGGANPGGVRPLPANLGLFVPAGRAINPVTKGNWEGVGIQPDIVVSKEKALEVALEKARTAAQTTRQERSKRAEETAIRIEAQLAQAQERLSSGKTQEGSTLVHAALKAGFDGGLHDEDIVNNTGYQALQAGKAALAVLIFEFNATRFPESPNTHDSLGEAYASTGQKEAAIASYRKALQLNPALPSAKEALAKLSVK